MLDTLLRVAIVAVVLAGAFAATGTLARRRGRNATAPLPAGLTVVSGPACTLCGPALLALRSAAPELEPAVVDGPPELIESLGIRSLPTALVVDDEGSVVLRRSGRAVVTDAHLLAAAARRLLAP